MKTEYELNLTIPMRVKAKNFPAARQEVFDIATWAFDGYKEAQVEDMYIDMAWGTSVGETE